MVNSSSISVWGLVYSRVLVGGKIVPLLIALFFINFEAKANVPFVLFCFVFFIPNLSLNC